MRNLCFVVVFLALLVVAKGLSQSTDLDVQSIYGNKNNGHVLFCDVSNCHYTAKANTDESTPLSPISTENIINNADFKMIGNTTTDYPVIVTDSGDDNNYEVEWTAKSLHYVDSKKKTETCSKAYGCFLVDTYSSCTVVITN